MKKKHILIIMIIAVLSLGLMAACSSSSSSDEPSYADQDFLKSMAKGLENRWDLTDKNEGKETTVQDMKDYIQAELDQVEPYQSAQFEDSVLQEKALAYINVLKTSMENVEYAFSVYDYEKWEDIYDQRTMMIKDFVDNYGLTVSDKHQSTLDELVANGKVAGKEADQKAAIQQLVDGLTFEVTKNEYGWKTYEAILENTSDYDIVDLSLEISLLDSEGVIVETAYTTAENVAKGQKARLEFYTEKEFEKYETVISWFDVK